MPFPSNNRYYYHPREAKSLQSQRDDSLSRLLDDPFESFGSVVLLLTIFGPPILFISYMIYKQFIRILDKRSYASCPVCASRIQTAAATSIFEGNLSVSEENEEQHFVWNYSPISHELETADLAGMQDGYYSSNGVWHVELLDYSKHEATETNVLNSFAHRKDCLHGEMEKGNGNQTGADTVMDHDGGENGMDFAEAGQDQERRTIRLRPAKVRGVVIGHVKESRLAQRRRTTSGRFD